jgi:hypothetical protein
MSPTLRLAAAGLILRIMGGEMPSEAAGEAVAAPTMRVLVLNPAGAPAAVLVAAEETAGRLFDQAGIQTRWRVAGVPAVHPDEASAADFGSMIMVSLMSAAMEARLHAPATELGFAVAGGRLANVMYGRVERLAGSTADLATVLGHVMAHEIGHLLLSTNAHGSGGIMNATLNLHLTRQGVLWFSAAEAHALRTRVVELAARRPAANPAAAAHDRVE